LKISGVVNEITNLTAFLGSVIDFADATKINLANASATSFRPARQMRVHLASALPTSGGFFPGISLKDDVANDGLFRFDFNEALLTQNFGVLGTPASSPPRFYFLVYKQIQEITIPNPLGGPGQTIPIFQPVYRSDSFRLNDLEDENDFSLFFVGLNDSGLVDVPSITQADVDTQIAGISLTGLSSLSGRIRDRHVRVTGRGTSGARLSFNVGLRPSTLSSLNSLLRHKIEDYELDVPFPANLCVDYGSIERLVRDNVRDLARDINTTIQSNLTDSIPDVIPGFDEEVFFTTNSTVTCADVDFPVVSQSVVDITGLGPFTLVVREIRLDLFIGFPRRIEA